MSAFTDAISRLFRNDTRLNKITNQTGTYDLEQGGTEETYRTFKARKEADFNSSMLAFNPRGAWATPNNYAFRDLVTNGGSAYVNVAPGAAGATFAADLAAGKWVLHQGNTPEQIAYNSDSIKTTIDRAHKDLRLTKFKSALAAMAPNASGRAGWLVYGDSVALSLFPDSFYFEMFRTYGLRGIWCGALSALGGTLYALGNLSGGTGSGASLVTGDYLSSPNGQAFSLSAAGHRSTFGFGRDAAGNGHTYGGAPTVFNKATIVYRKKSGGGVFKLQTINPWDGFELPQDVVGSTAVSTDDAGGGLATIVVNFATVDYWQLSALWQSGGEVRIAGCFLENTTTRGIVYANFSLGGLEMTNSNTMPQANLAVILNLVQPDICTWAFKDSDLANQLVLHKALWDSAYATDWLYLTAYPDSGAAATAAGARAASAPIISFALANGFDYYDTLLDCPDYAYGTSRGWFADSTHFNNVAAGAIAPRLIRSLGILPGYKAGVPNGAMVPDTQYARALVATDSLTVNGFDVERRTRRTRGQLATAGRGLRVPASTYGGVFGDVDAAPIGASAFTMVCFVRVPAALGFCEFMGMYPAAASPPGTVGLSLNVAQGAFNLGVTPDGGGSIVFNQFAAVQYLLTIPNEVAMITVRRRTSGVAAGEGALDLFINNKRFSFSNQGTNDPLFSASNLRFKMGCVGQSVGPQGDWEFYGAGRYLSALTDAQIDECWIRGDLVPGWDIYWRLDEQIGEAVAHPGTYRGRLNGGAWRVPNRRVPTQMVNISNAKTLVPGEMVLANWAANGNRQLFTLPASPAVYDEVEVSGSVGSWRIVQPAGHRIAEAAGATIGTNASTPGVTGYMQSANTLDGVRLRCVIADLATPAVTWVPIAKTGAPAYA